MTTLCCFPNTTKTIVTAGILRKDNTVKMRVLSSGENNLDQGQLGRGNIQTNTYFVIK